MVPQLKTELEQMEPVTDAHELNMTNILQFPPATKQLLIWMMRQKVVNPKALAEHLNEDFISALEILGLMVRKGLVEEIKTEHGEEGYTISIRSSRNYRVPDKVWKAIDE